ncbi:MAG: hypothetical protein JWP05_663 [Microbacteriaceae bacterium]|nr:hypothetical protein [Microbacteriaceae bacterium]
MVAETVFLFPVPYDFSWLNHSWQPFLAQLSAGVLVVAFTILAVGIRKESGIAGASIIGKLSIILVAVAGFALSVIAPTSVALLGTSPNVLALLAVGLWSSWVLGVAERIVASIVVFRAGVIRGVARWGLIVLAVTTVVTVAAGRLHSVAAGEVWLWGSAAELVIQFSIGVVYLAHGQTAALKHGLQVVPG